MSDPLEEAVCRSPEQHAAATKRHGHLWDYIIEGETPAQRHHRHVQAMRLCFTCPTINACRTERHTVAAGPDEAIGVWHGQLFLPPDNTHAGVGRPKAS